LSPVQHLCFNHFAAYCIIGTMPGALLKGSAHLRSQITAFLNFCRLEKGLSVNSLDAYTTDLARFKEFIGDATDLPGTPEIRLHIDNLYQTGLGSRSVGRHLTTIRNFYGFLLREGAISTDPTEHLRRGERRRVSLVQPVRVTRASPRARTRGRKPARASSHCAAGLQRSISGRRRKKF